MRRNADPAGPGAQRRFARQSCRTGHALATSDEQHVTVVAFVRLPVSQWQCRTNGCLIGMPYSRLRVVFVGDTER